MVVWALGSGSGKGGREGKRDSRTQLASPKRLSWGILNFNFISLLFSEALWGPSDDLLCNKGQGLSTNNGLVLKLS